MTRIHGRGGVAYLALASGGAASPVAFLSGWDVSYTREIFDVTAITDTQVIHAAGDPDASGSFTGYYDTATAQSYAAAVDGQPRSMFLYPSITRTDRFFSGMVLPDYSIGAGVTSAASLSVKWAAAGPVTLATGSSSASPATLAVTAVVPAPLVTPKNATASPAVLAVTAAIPVPSVTTGGGGAVYAAVYPSVYGGTTGNATVIPATLAVTTTRPAVTIGPAGLLDEAAAAITDEAGVPVLNEGGNTAASPAVLAITTTRPAVTVRAYPETSPALELSGFTISGPGASDTIEWVRVSVTEHQGNAAQAPCTFELWNGTSARIGAVQTGTASTSTGNISTAIFTGVTFSQLATLRVRIYGHAAVAGYAESADGVSLAVSYSPVGGGANISPATLAVTGTVTFSAAGSSSSITLIADDVITVTASIPVPVVT